jgi:hypothetical protein
MNIETSDCLKHCLKSKYHLLKTRIKQGRLLEEKEWRALGV